MLVFDKLSTGAADDLSKATEIARSMVTRYGMDEALGLVTYDDQPSAYLDEIVRPRVSAHSFSERSAAEIDEAIKLLMSEAFRRASDILSLNRRMLDETATKLLEKETLSGDELPMPTWEPQEDQPNVRSVRQPASSA